MTIMDLCLTLSSTFCVLQNTLASKVRPIHRGHIKILTCLQGLGE